MTKSRRIGLTAIAAAVAFIAGLQLARWLAVGPPPTGPAEDLRAQVFVDLDGGTQRNLAQFSGRVILVNFWATWCTPCREEMPLLQHTQAQYPQDRLQVVAIALDDAEAVRRFRDELDLRFPIWLDQRGAAVDLMARYGNRARGLPFSLWLSADGEVLGNKLGAYKDTELLAALEKYVVRDHPQ